MPLDLPARSRPGNVADVTTYPLEGLVPPDPTWPELYARLAAVLEAELGPAWRIEHIGSTSVSGLRAKPVIDMAVRLPDGERLGDHTDAFRRAGWSEPIDLAVTNACSCSTGRFDEQSLTSSPLGNGRLPTSACSRHGFVGIPTTAMPTRN
jgi:hypothetical protein